MVAIIDDDESVRDGFVDFVRAMGLEAESFECAEQFLQSGIVAETACVITDFRMPGMTGLDLRDHLVASGTPIPTIVVTAFPKETDRARALRSGVTHYLAKPVDGNELSACIAAALGPRNADRSEG